MEDSFSSFNYIFLHERETQTVVVTTPTAANNIKAPKKKPDERFAQHETKPKIKVAKNPKIPHKPK